MFTSLAVLYISVLGQVEFVPPDDAALEAFRLPQAVALDIEVTYVTEVLGELTETRFRNRLELSWDWVHFENRRVLGTIGDSLVVAATSTWDETLYFDPQSDRAKRERYMQLHGRAPGEHAASPITDLRVIALMQQRGLDVTEESLPNGHSLMIGAGSPPFPRIQIEYDDDTNEIVRVYRGPANRQAGGWAEFEYLDWESLPGGTHHPTRIIERIQEPNKEVIETVHHVTQIKILDPQIAPKMFRLPAHTLVDDQIDGVIRTAAGKILSDDTLIPPGIQQPGTQAKASSRALLLIAGVGVLILAGVVWQLKRKGVVA